MAHFRYNAIDANQQPVSGEVTADSARAAVEQLEERGLSIQSIEQCTDQPAPGNGSPAADDVPEALHRLFETLFQYRADVLPGLTAYHQEVPVGPRRQELSRVIRLLQQGDVSVAVDSYGALAHCWTPLLTAASTAEHGGQVVPEFQQRWHHPAPLHRRAWWLLTYPTMLCLLAGAVLVVLSLLVVPTFRDIFREFDMELPDMTRLVLAIAEFITSRAVVYLLLALVGLLVVAWMASWLWLGSALARVATGRRTRTWLAGQLARQVADLLEAGLPGDQAVRAAQAAVGHRGMAEAAAHLADSLPSGGGRLTRHDHRLLTHTFTWAMHGDMPRSSRIHLLRELSRACTDAHRPHALYGHGASGALAILVVGAIVGFTVLALFLPLISLVEGLS